MAFNWNTYIRNRLWYRGVGEKGADVRRRVLTLAATKRRGTTLLTARLTPKKGYSGTDPDLALKLGIYKKWLELEKRGKWRESQIYLGRVARKRGLDIQAIDKTQVSVFNPKIIQLVLRGENKIPVKPTHRLSPSHTSKVRRGRKRIRRDIKRRTRSNSNLKGVRV